MYGYQYAQSASAMKALCIFVGLLLVGAVVAGVFLGSSELFSPTLHTAKADKLKAETEALRAQIADEQRQREIELRLAEEKAAAELQALQDRRAKELELLESVGIVVLMVGSVVVSALVATVSYCLGERSRVLPTFQRIDESARESERERLREDLHDTMNLMHALIMLEAERILELVQAGEYQEAEISLRVLWQNARFVNFDQLGKLLEDMRDPILVDKGLAVALQNYVERIRAFEVLLDIKGRGRLPFRTEHILYRIAQQALGNVAKHACLNEVENGKVQVTLIIGSKNVILAVADNGVGFDAKKKLERRDALGLSVIKRWARSIDAQFEIRSCPDRGTTVCAVAPLGKGMRP